MQESLSAPELCRQQCWQDEEEPRALPKEDEGNAESQQQVHPTEMLTGMARKNHQKRARPMPNNHKSSGKDLPKKRKHHVKKVDQLPIEIISIAPPELRRTITPSTTQSMKNKIARARAKIAMTRIVNNLRNQELATISDTCTPLCYTFYNYSCPSCCCL